MTSMYIFFFFILVINLCKTDDGSMPSDWVAFNNALDSLFYLESGANPLSSHELCNKNIRDVLIRQDIPLDANRLKNMSNVDLYKLSILAAFTGISSWKRNNDNQILLNDFGHPLESFNVLTVEGDVLLCIICALLIVIATSHMLAAMDEMNDSAPLTSSHNTLETTVDKGHVT